MQQRPAPHVDHGDHAAGGGSRSNVRESGRARFLLGKVRTPGGEGMMGVRAKRRRPASRLDTKNKLEILNVFVILESCRVILAKLAPVGRAPSPAARPPGRAWSSCHVIQVLRSRPKRRRGR